MYSRMNERNVCTDQISNQWEEQEETNPKIKIRHSNDSMFLHMQRKLDQRLTGFYSRFTRKRADSSVGGTRGIARSLPFREFTIQLSPTTISAGISRRKRDKLPVFERRGWYLSSRGSERINENEGTREKKNLGKNRKIGGARKFSEFIRTFRLF